MTRDVLSRLVRHPLIVALATTACTGSGLVAGEDEIVEPIGRHEQLLIVNTDVEEGAYWYLVKGGEKRLIGTDLSCLHNVESVEPSPDLRFLAVRVAFRR